MILLLGSICTPPICSLNNRPCSASQVDNDQEPQHVLSPAPFLTLTFNLNQGPPASNPPNAHCPLVSISPASWGQAAILVKGCWPDRWGSAGRALDMTEACPSWLAPGMCRCSNSGSHHRLGSEKGMFPTLQSGSAVILQPILTI